MTKKFKITVISLLCAALILAASALGLAIAAYNPPIHMGDFLDGKRAFKITCIETEYPDQPTIELTAEECEEVLNAMRLTVLIDTRSREIPNGGGYHLTLYNDLNEEILFFCVSGRYVSFREQKGAGYEGGGYLYSVVEKIYAPFINEDY